jgi:heme iron utilization protein
MALTKSDAVTHSRHLLREGRSATLSTALATHQGWPYASFVTYATDHSGALIFLFSDLSDHARNLQADNRASVLVERTSNRKHPQTGPRVTLVGKIRKTREPAHAERFFARHPRARMYAGFADFHFYRMPVERSHYVGGFAKAVWFRGRDLQVAADVAAPFADAEAEILQHMNTDHADAVDLYANRLLDRKGTGWQMTGVDADGLDVGKDGRFARLAFDVPLKSVEDVRAELVRLAQKARTTTA